MSNASTSLAVFLFGVLAAVLILFGVVLWIGPTKTFESGKR